MPPPTITTSYEEWKRHCDKKGGRFEFVVCFHLTSFFKWLKVLHLCQQVFMAFVYISQLILKLRASACTVHCTGRLCAPSWKSAVWLQRWNYYDERHLDNGRSTQLNHIELARQWRLGRSIPFLYSKRIYVYQMYMYVKPIHFRINPFSFLLFLSEPINGCFCPFQKWADFCHRFCLQ